MVKPTPATEVIIVLAFVIPPLILIAMMSYFWRAHKRFRGLIWSVRNTNVLFDGASTITGLRVFLDETRAETLSVTLVALWNPGIKRLDMSGIDGLLKIEGTTPKVHIVDTRTVQASFAENEVRLRDGFDQRFVDLGLPNLDPQQGAVLQVVHTGISSADIRIASDRPDLALKYRPPASLRLARSWRDKPFNPRAVYGTMALVVIAWTVAFITRFKWAGNPRVIEIFHEFWILSFGVAFALEVVFQRERSSHDGEPRVPVPRELDRFFEN